MKGTSSMYEAWDDMMTAVHASTVCILCIRGYQDGWLHVLILCACRCPGRLGVGARLGLVPFAELDCVPADVQKFLLPERTKSTRASAVKAQEQMKEQLGGKTETDTRGREKSMLIT